MTESETAEKLIRVFEKTNEMTGLMLATPVNEVVTESIQAIRNIVVLEIEFGIDVEEKPIDFREFATIGHLAAHIHQLTLNEE
jgi:hypothetical protein